MKQLITFLLAFLFSYAGVFAQNDPHWTKSAWRTSEYPSDVYLTGYSRDTKSNDEKLAKADFLISVEASAREYNNANNTYFSYVDATVDIKKAYNGEQIYQDEITQKGGSTRSYKSAAGEAYDDIIYKIEKKLVDIIK